MSKKQWAATAVQQRTCCILNVYIRITDELLISAVKSGTAMAGVTVAVPSPMHIYTGSRFR